MARRCFTCTACDGRIVTLFKERYDGHILGEHPELVRDYDYPAQMIEHALTNVASDVVAGQGRAVIYKGPPVQANPPAGAQRIHVVVLPDQRRRGEWWVVTAYGVIVL